MAASGGRYRLAWLETLLNDCQFLLGCPPPAANITRQQFNVSILVRHKPDGVDASFATVVAISRMSNTRRLTQ